VLRYEPLPGRLKNQLTHCSAKGRSIFMPLAQGVGRKYTFRDYSSWPDDERWELIDGEPFAMTPAPSVKHQRAVVKLASILEPMLASSPCTLILAPTDLVLSESVFEKS
jgi:hypothetical protein